MYLLIDGVVSNPFRKLEFMKCFTPVDDLYVYPQSGEQRPHRWPSRIHTIRRQIDISSLGALNKLKVPGVHLVWKISRRPMPVIA
jgi:hypothetical protein